MLKHEENSVVSSLPAAQVRVTPQELAAALARIEARQGEQEGTIPLGDAVQELGLNTTPEELLREIEAGRARSHQNRRRAPLLRGNTLGVGAVFSLALLMFGGMAHFLRTPVPPPPSVAVSASQVVPKPISLDPNLLVGDETGKLVVLSEVGENQPVHCSYGEGGFQQYSPDGSGSSWVLIKHGGQVYVRGLMPRISEQALRRDGTDISIIDSSGFVVPITLSLNGFEIMPEVGSNVEFHAVNIHLDKYAYEKWSP